MSDSIILEFHRGALLQKQFTIKYKISLKYSIFNLLSIVNIMNYCFTHFIGKKKVILQHSNTYNVILLLRRKHSHSVPKGDLLGTSSGLNFLNNLRSSCQRIEARHVYWFKNNPQQKEQLGRNNTNLLGVGDNDIPPQTLREIILIFEI